MGSDRANISAQNTTTLRKKENKMTNEELETEIKDLVNHMIARAKELGAHKEIKYNARLDGITNPKLNENGRYFALALDKETGEACKVFYELDCSQEFTDLEIDWVDYLGFIDWASFCNFNVHGEFK
jgi:hypothetical protein